MSVRDIVQAAAGAGGGDKLYVEDVFSTWLYTGTGASQTINNGIDLAGEGGMVWIKCRPNAGSHNLFDTERGALKYLFSNSTNAQATDSVGLSGFNSDGFSLLGGSGSNNQSGVNYASWTFRKASKFFDVVTYTGTGANRTVAHNLGSVPGMIIVKNLSAGDSWAVYHRSTGATNELRLNSTIEAFASSTAWNDTNPTSTVFTVGTGDRVNTSGAQYVAYLFAHNAGGFGEAGDQSVVSCGSFTTDASGNATVNLGWEPQWVVIKRSDGDSSWIMLDNMRGWFNGAGDDARLRANLSDAEDYVSNFGAPTATGFNVSGVDSSATHIYLAIRRGPMKKPTSGTQVFSSLTVTQADSLDTSTVPFPPDLVNTFSRNGTDRTAGYNNFLFVDRLRGIGTPNNTFNSSGAALISSSTGAENITTSYVQLKADSMNITRGFGWNSLLYGNWINYFFRRAPGFFDVVCYTGTGVARTVNHNLGVAPELMIVKSRSGAGLGWGVYAAPLGATDRLILEDTGGTVSNPAYWNNTSPTSTQFTVNTVSYVNQTGATYVAYLFATLPGVSKVGSYTGTGTTQNIDCGFTAGARFVLIKRTDSTGDWYVWDTARGIVAGSDPYLLLNSTAAEVTTTDYIDPVASGFEISSTAPAAINASGGSFIYLAIS